MRNQQGEFLFDLVIHESRNKFLFTGRRLWAVESEFEERNHDVRRDLAKLFWADVENRLFVCSSAKGPTVLDEVSSWEKLTRGALYACRLLHPRDWEPGIDSGFELKMFGDQKWQEIKSPLT